MDAFEPIGELVVETGEYEVRNGEAYRYIARAGAEINYVEIAGTVEINGALYLIYSNAY